ncbi:MAG TPA: tetratricopeptide repeat protein [Pirellulales bacterium]
MKPRIKQSPDRNQATRDRSRAPTRAAIPPALAGAALLVMVFVAYAPALKAGFVWDDDYNITRNPTLLSWYGLRQMWSDPESIQQYYPLMYTTFWVEYRLWGFAPLGYHLVNLALHGVAAILAWRLLLRLRVPGAWLAAALFAVHPVMVESVVWVTERKNVLSLSLALASMLCYLRFAPCEDASAEAPSGNAPSSEELSNAPPWRWYAAAWGLFALALSAKTIVVTMPAVLLVIYWWKRGNIGRREVALTLPFFALSLFAGLITVWMELFHVGAKGNEWSLDAVERVLLAGRALWFYAGKLVWPDPIVFFYPRWDVDARVWWQYLFPVAAVIVPVCLWLARHRIGRGPLAAVLIYAGVLMPALGFVNIYYMQFAYVADHFQYHASIALFALAAAGATLWARKLSPLSLRWARLAVAMLLVALSAVSFRQSRVYENLEVLYRNTIAQNPQCWMAYINLMTYLDAQDRYNDSLELIRTCIAELDEAGVEGMYRGRAEKGLGLVLMETGQHQEAELHFLKSLAAEPDEPKALYGLGMARLKLSNWEAAAATFQRAVELDSNYADGYYGLGVARANQGRFAEAMDLLNRSLEINPADPLTHFELGNALVQQGKLNDAAAQYRAAIELRPSFPEALHNLSVMEFQLGDLDQAILHSRATLQLNPNNEPARAALKSFEEARANQRSSRP